MLNLIHFNSFSRLRRSKQTGNRCFYQMRNSGELFICQSIYHWLSSNINHWPMLQVIQMMKWQNSRKQKLLELRLTMEYMCLVQTGSNFGNLVDLLMATLSPLNHPIYHWPSSTGIQVIWKLVNAFYVVQENSLTYIL